MKPATVACLFLAASARAAQSSICRSGIYSQLAPLSGDPSVYSSCVSRYPQTTDTTTTTPTTIITKSTSTTITETETYTFFSTQYVTRNAKRVAQTPSVAVRTSPSLPDPPVRAPAEAVKVKARIPASSTTGIIVSVPIPTAPLNPALAAILLIQPASVKATFCSCIQPVKTTTVTTTYSSTTTNTITATDTETVPFFTVTTVTVDPPPKTCLTAKAPCNSDGDCNSECGCYARSPACKQAGYKGVCISYQSISRCTYDSECSDNTYCTFNRGGQVVCAGDGGGRSVCTAKRRKMRLRRSDEPEELEWA